MIPLSLQFILEVHVNNKFFIAKLRDQQKITYKKYYAIATPGETRWNSYYAVCTSLLKTRQALQVNLLIYLLLN